MLHEHALPPGSVRGNHCTHWKSLFGFLERNLSAWGMEHCLEPTATPEEFGTCHENCKIVLKERVSHFFEKEGGEEAFERAISTWAWMISWEQINEKGTASDKQNNEPKSSGNKERQMVFTWKQTLKENVQCKDRQEKRAEKMASLVSDSDSSDSPRKSDNSSPSSRKSDGSSSGSGGVAAQKLDGSGAWRRSGLRRRR